MLPFRLLGFVENWKRWPTGDEKKRSRVLPGRNSSGYNARSFSGLDL
jgi:hypothetical protein